MIVIKTKLNSPIFKRSLTRTTLTSGVLISMTSIALALSTPTFANTKYLQENSSEILSGNSSENSPEDRFYSDFFMVYSPQTLYDVLERIPGANTLLVNMNNASQSRGFGSAGDQILINSKRVSGKENSIQNELDNIQAQDVDYIELIRGTRSDLDVQSNGLVINVILKKHVEPAILWSLGSIKSLGFSPKPFGSVVYSAGLTDIKYRIGLVRSANPSNINTTEQFTSPEGARIQTDTSKLENWYLSDQLTAKLEYLYSDKTAMQFNALYENVFLDREKINTIDNWTSGEQTLRSTIFDWDKDNWEISGDISHQIDENNQLKLLFISNHSCFT